MTAVAKIAPPSNFTSLFVVYVFCCGAFALDRLLLLLLLFTLPLFSANVLPAVCIYRAIPPLVLVGYRRLNSSVCIIAFDVIILFNYSMMILLN